uniref:Uncharacterized protein n=1 Tax=Glossina pallidipes TaxID=7398 RepID=A0A1A9ZK44_GLOPL
MKRYDLFNKLTNISGKCFDVQSIATSSELSSDDETDHIQSESSETEDENEDVINTPRKSLRQQMKTKYRKMNTKKHLMIILAVKSKSSRNMRPSIQINAAKILNGNFN